MKIVDSKNLSFVSILILVILVISLAYQVSKSYREHKDIEREKSKIVLIDKFNSLLHMVEEQKGYSEIYKITKEEQDLKKIKLYRVKVIEKIKELLLYTREESEYITYNDTLEDLHLKLNRDWSQLTQIEEDKSSVYVKESYIKIISSLIYSIKKLSTEIQIEDKVTLSYYIELLILEDSLTAEEAFISYTLSSSKKMINLDYLLWEKFIGEEVVPDFSSVKNSILRNKLENTLDATYFSMIGEKERGKIFLDSVGGVYEVSLKEWLTLFRNRLSQVTLAEELILSDIRENSNVNYISTKEELFKYSTMFIFFLMFFLLLIYIYSNLDKNSRFLSETLKDIEADLDEKQKKEIKEVLKRNDTIEIYKFLANAIKEPSRAKDHFLANMSHEIRTPLNGIIGFTTILKETELKDEQKEFLNIIEESSNNLITIVNDILDFSKVTSGKVEFENISFDVMQKFEASIDSYAAKAAQKNIELGLFIDPELPVELMGDATKISQVMINLLSNAIKFTEKDGEINVSIVKESETKDDVTVKFSVQDSGIGITKDQQSKIFDAFSQADASTSRKFGGTGLGLTISSKFVNLMGGILDIESVLGEGTTFFFSISLNKSEKSVERVKPNLEDLNIAYLSVEGDTSIDKNLETYISYSGASFKAYSYQEILDEGEYLPADIIFVERKAIQNDIEMKSLLELNRKIVILTTTEMSSCNSAIRDKIAKVVYKPVNFSKTLGALNVAKSNNIVTAEKIKKVSIVKSSKVFTGLNVLVAEDNIINQKLIKNILNGFDINVSIANNGEEAFNAYQENRYDMIFMDIQMPILSGVEATKKIIEYEKMNKLEHVPIVALTANVIESDKKKYLASGMDRYLRKPIDVKNLIAVIENLFPLYELRDSLSLGDENTIEETYETDIILYKETELTGKIYAAVLNNLGYKVDMYSNENEFLEQLDSKKYSFALFDAKPFKTINSDRLVVDLIQDSGAIPIAFVEKDYPMTCCATLHPVGNVKDIKHKLLCS